ncbi:transcription termination/antitermination protein NusG [Azospirillum palustre]
MTDQFSDREWFAIVVKPGRSEEVHRRLLEQRYRSFRPLCLTERRNREKGRMEEIVRPLFDRYQFVGVHSEQPFSPIQSTIGVAFVVRGVGHMPLRVSPLVLRRVAARFNEDGVVDLRPARSVAGPMVTWEPGDMLEVIDGPFREFSATLLEWADKRREVARVLVNIFGRVTPLEAPVGALRPMGEVRAA